MRLSVSPLDPLRLLVLYEPIVLFFGIVAAVDIRAHETIAQWMLTFKRPGSGLEPRHWEKVIGMTARRNIGKDTILQWEDLAPSESANSGFSNLNRMEQAVDQLRTQPQNKRHA